MTVHPFIPSSAFKNAFYEDCVELCSEISVNLLSLMFWNKAGTDSKLQHVTGQPPKCEAITFFSVLIPG